jgi:ankyrin repeat protein
MRSSAAWQLAMCCTTGFGVTTAVHEADSYFSQASKLGSDIAQALSPLVFRSGAGHDGNTYKDAVLGMLASRTAAGTPSVAFRNTSRISSCDMSDINEIVHVSRTGSSTSIIDRTESSDQRQNTVAATMIKLEDAIRRKDCAEILSLHIGTPIQAIVCQEPLLIQGLRTRDRKVVETLLECGLSPETKDGSGRTAFHWLFWLDDTSIYAVGQSLAKFRGSKALNLSADKMITIHPQWPLQLRGTPLAHAIAVGSRATVKALIDLGADLLAPDYTPESFKTKSGISWTPIHVAVSYHHPEILRDLLSAADEAHIPTSRFPRLLAHALCNSTVFEQMAMHGRNYETNLRETIELLGRPEILEEQSQDGVTSIMHAMNRIDFRLVSALLQRDISIASQRLVSLTSGELSIFHYPIHQAAHLASRSDDPVILKLLELLIEHDHDSLNRRDHDGRTCLHIAASGTSSRASLFLVQQAPSLLAATDKHGAFPLHYCESPSVAEKLYALGARMDAVDSYGKTVLHNAVIKGLGPLVKKLCEMRTEFSMSVSTNYSPLHAAVQHMRHDITVALLGYGASPDDQNNVGNTALHIAAMASPQHILKALIGAGADVTILNNQGISPLYIAVDCQNAGAIKELSSHRPELIMTPRRKLDKDEPTMSPLLLCAEKDKDGIDYMLPLISRMDLEAIDSNGRSILHVAAMRGSLHLVSRLVQFGIDLNVQDSHGETALMFAIRHRYLPEDRMDCARICQDLIDHGASTTAQNEAGEMAWDVAINDIRDETYDVLSILLRHSEESCRNVTKQSKKASPSNRYLISLAHHIREPCEDDLVYEAIHRPHQKLLMALKARLPETVFKKAEDLAVQDVDQNLASTSREILGDAEWRSRMERKHLPVPEELDTQRRFYDPRVGRRIGDRFMLRRRN